MHGTSGPSQFHKGISEETRLHIFQDVPVKMWKSVNIWQIDKSLRLTFSGPPGIGNHPIPVHMFRYFYRMTYTLIKLSLVPNHLYTLSSLRAVFCVL